MGKISEEARQQYFDRIKEYKQVVDAISQREQSILKVMRADESGAAYKYLMLSDERLNLASHYLLQNSLSVALLGVKNDGALNEARKSCYQSIIYLEEVVTNYLDAPFTDYSDKLEEIEGFEDVKRYRLVRKLGFTIQSVEDDFGANSKWRWSFVELEGRFAVVAKNLINFKTFIAGLDPRADGYKARMDYLALIKDLLTRSADRHREKYELSTLRMDDIKRGIAFLSALRRIHLQLGESEQADTVKRKIDVWTSKMDADDKRRRQKRPAK